jgi:hypothetical protein
MTSIGLLSIIISLSAEFSENYNKDKHVAFAYISSGVQDNARRVKCVESMLDDVDAWEWHSPSRQIGDAI